MLVFGKGGIEYLRAVRRKVEEEAVVKERILGMSVRSWEKVALDLTNRQVQQDAPP